MKRKILSLMKSIERENIRPDYFHAKKKKYRAGCDRVMRGN